MRLWPGVLAATLFLPFSVNAQSYGELDPHRDLRADTHMVLANAALGGITAALFKRQHRGERMRAFRDGAIGGSVAFAGKRIAVERWGGAGFIRREIGSIGHFIIANASNGDPLLSRITLPVGPVRFYVVRGDSGRTITTKFDLPSLLYAGYRLVKKDAFAWRASASSGVLVFRVTDKPLRIWQNRCVSAFTVGGVIVMNDLTPRAVNNRNPGFAHERVHAGQFDQLFTTMSNPAEQALAKNFTGLVELNAIST